MGLFVVRDRRRWAGCYSRLAPEGLLCEIARGGGNGAVQEREREQEGVGAG